MELADIQGNILTGYGYPLGCHLFVRASPGLLARLVDQVTTARPWTEKPASTLNIAVTYAGFAALGVPDRLLALFPAAFRQSTKDRAALLGDDPGCWEPGLGTGEAHLLLSVHALSEVDLSRAVAQLGVDPLHEQWVRALPDRREHFGYVDGLGQPEVEGVPGRRGGGEPVAGDGWRPIRAGEFILGYPDEEGLVAGRPDPALVRNGSYLVYRKLQQDVARFRAALREAADRSGLPEDLLAAKVVGRSRAGEPLLGAGPNDFRYRDDKAGYGCPRGAHIRRANPRDALGAGLAARHRIIRRSMPYGPRLEPDAAEDPLGGRRGLIFQCFNADIERQFETIQSAWLNDGDAFHLGDDRDFLLGGNGKMTIEGHPPAVIEAQPGLVVTRGMEYLFAPGIAALRRLARGA